MLGHLQTDLRVGGRVKSRPFNDAMRELEILSRLSAGPGILIKRDRTGMTISARRQTLPSGGGIAFPAFVLQSGGVFGDHMVCKDANGNIENIAKAWMLRRSPWVGKNEARNGVFVTYTSYGSTGRSRRVRVSGEDEDQVVVPGYVTDDVIYAAPLREDDWVQVADGITAKFVDVNVDARAWGAIRAV